MRQIRILLAIVTSVVLTGCINSTTLIKVKADGSGTVEQTTLMNVRAMKSMMPGMQQSGQAPNVVNRADLEKTAARMGKGVRLLSAEPTKNDNGFEGVKAIFEFDDINQIQVSQDPNTGGGGDARLSTEPTKDDPVKFKLTRTGSTSVLTINFTDKPGGGDTPSQAGDMPDLTNPMIMGMIKSMMQGFKINIGLEVLGSIVKTNAEYVDGPRITLLEMDLEALLADEAKFKALQGKLGPDASLSEVKPYLKDIKGIKIDGPSISVEFK
ncbi:MAG: hypothetical protein Q7R30_06925 [Acidobacteriota bacterium]|nr:hypothetical protein [Acidobacteriota bacterium]